MSLGRGPSGTLSRHSTVSSPLSVSYRERTPFRLHLSSSLAIISSARDMCSVRRALSFLLPGRLRLLVLSPQAPRELQHFSHFPCTPAGETGGDPAPASGEQLVAQPGLAREEPPGGRGGWILGCFGPWPFLWAEY